LNTKSRLLGHCKEIVKARLFNAEDAMNRAQESANDNEKSSAGDKFETGRAMGHLEKEMFSRQYQESLLALQKIQSIESKTGTQEIALGSLVVIDTKFYLIAIGLGKVNFEDREYYIVSEESPLGQSIIGLRKNDTITINKVKMQIIDIQ
jgi:transcription elongation GreA/GreB family factor